MNNFTPLACEIDLKLLHIPSAYGRLKEVQLALNKAFSFPFSLAPVEKLNSFTNENSTQCKIVLTLSLKIGEKMEEKFVEVLVFLYFTLCFPPIFSLSFFFFNYSNSTPVYSYNKRGWLMQQFILFILPAKYTPVQVTPTTFSSKMYIICKTVSSSFLFSL